MKLRRQVSNVQCSIISLVTVVIAISATWSVSGSEKETRQYSLEVLHYSIIESKESFRFHGKGSGGGIRLFADIAPHRYDLTITSYTTNNQFIVEGEVQPKGDASATEHKKFKRNLTDLKPLQVQLDEDGETGRRFLVNLSPDLIVDESGSPSELTDSVSVASMHFENSAVIINDKHYAGRISAMLTFESRGASLAYVNVTGIGRVEFALAPFDGAEPIGTLKGNHIHLPIKDSVAIDITPVWNADFNAPFPEGPYKVWAKVSDKAEYADLEVIKELVKKMDPENPKRKGMKKVLEAVRNEEQTVMGYGIREIPLD